MTQQEQAQRKSAEMKKMVIVAFAIMQVSLNKWTWVEANDWINQKKLTTILITLVG